MFDAKLWDLFEGLKILQRKGYGQVSIQVDGLEVVTATLVNPPLNQIQLSFDKSKVFYLTKGIGLFVTLR